MKNAFSSSIEDSLQGRSSVMLPTNDESVKKESPDKSNSATSKKHHGGRPTNASKGMKRRKQYTITLVPEMYIRTLAAANEEGISFSKYVERALIEYQNLRDSN